jgi:hypothetical protein
MRARARLRTLLDIALDTSAHAVSNHIPPPPELEPVIALLATPKGSWPSAEMCCPRL